MKKQRKTQAIRFWFPWNGSWIKLSIPEGSTESIEFSRSFRDEEGFFFNGETFYLYNNFVYRHSEKRASDCDGRTSDDMTLRCHIKKLNSSLPYSEEEEYCPVKGAKLPKWEKVSSKYRDYSAEAAGY